MGRGHSNYAFRCHPANLALTWFKIFRVGTYTKYDYHTILYFLSHNTFYDRPLPSDRVFATLQILLPSSFTGGQVEIKFGRAATRYDVDQASETSVSAIAWYMDAAYKTLPIVSGYQLTLSYEIIHTLPTPVPQLSFMLGNLAKLRRMLGYWVSKDTFHPIPRMLAFILKSNYKEDEYGVGVLTRNDGRKLQPVTDSLGFKLFIAALNCHISGEADDQNDSLLTRSGPSRWSRPYHDGLKLPTMTRVRSKRLQAKDFVDLDGVSYPHMTGWSLDEKDIALHVALQKYVPDVAEYGGFHRDVSSTSDPKRMAAYYRSLFVFSRGQGTSNFVGRYLLGRLDIYSGLVFTGFQRSILCILPVQTYVEFLLHILPHRISLWETKVDPSYDNDVKLMFDSLAWNRLSPWVPKLVDRAIQWEQLPTWGHILDAAVRDLGTNPRVLGTLAFFRACDTFAFGPTVARLEQSLRKQGLERLIMVASIPEYHNVYMSNRTVAEWRKRYTRHILRSSTELGQEEITTLLGVIKQVDLRFVRDM